MNKPKQMEHIDAMRKTLKQTIRLNGEKITSNSTDHKSMYRSPLASNLSTASTSSNSSTSKSHRFGTSRSNQITDSIKSVGDQLNNKPTSKYLCQLCGIDFCNLERYNFHLIKIHKLDQRINLLQCYVIGCDEKFKRRMQLVDHLNEVHKLDVVVVTKIVRSLDEFARWKDTIEKKSNCIWIENNKFYLNNRLRKTYICNRPASNGCKVYSLHGETTINNHSTFCLSSIKLIENDDGSFFIEFIETHNHDE